MLTLRGFKRVLTCAAALLFISGSGVVLADVTINDILENVRRNEALYSNIDATFLTEYSTRDRPAAKFSNGSEETTAQEIEGHYVVQGEYFRLDRKGTSRGETSVNSLDRIRGFDGKTTRLYDQNAIGNIIRGREEDADWLRPHMIFMRHICQVPLSIYLAGHEAMASHPRGNWTGNSTLDRKYDGIRRYEGFDCHVVQVDQVLPEHGAINRWELWLAEQRNYIPVRAITYIYQFSKNAPIAEGRITDMHEVKPGIWFPSAAVFTSYNPAVLMYKGEQEFMWERRFTTKSISLDPHYDISYFRDIVFPQGTAVYELEASHVTRKYREGSPGTESTGGNRAIHSSYLWLVVLNIAVVACAAVALKRRARR